MMRNTNIYVLISGIIILLFFSCKESKRDRKYYSLTIDKDSIPYEYLAVFSIDKSNGIREDITYYYSNITYDLVKKTVENWQIDKDNMYLIRKNKEKLRKVLYLSISDLDTCVEWNHENKMYNQVAKTINCYKGIKEIEIGKHKIRAHEFIRTEGCVISRVYYNKEFIMMRHEYIQGGDIPNFMLEKINFIPNKFRYLLDSLSNAGRLPN